MQTMYWLIIFVILLIVEIATLGLTTIWFAAGSLTAFVFGVIGFGTTVQLVVFLIVSVLLFAITRPIAVKYFNKERAKTNAESLIGEQALVIEDIDTYSGREIVWFPVEKTKDFWLKGLSAAEVVAQNLEYTCIKYID